MKKIITILILIFSLQTPSQADDIRDFQIEGMSIGDNLFDYITKEELKNKKKAYYKNKKYIAILIYKPTFETYEMVQIVYKNIDKKIHNLDGIFYYKKNFKDCLKKKDEIVADIIKIFPESKKKEKGKIKHDADKSGKSVFFPYDFEFKSGASARVICYDWSEEKTKNNNWPDSLAVTINSEEFTNFLKNQPY